MKKNKKKEYSNREIKNLLREMDHYASIVNNIEDQTLVKISGFISNEVKGCVWKGVWNDTWDFFENSVIPPIRNHVEKSNYFKN